MIIEYEEDGRITHVINDPVYPGMADTLTAQGVRFADFPPAEIVIEEGEDGPVTESVLAECDIATDYILNGTITRRPTIAAPAEHVMTVGEQLILSSLPDPCTVYLDDQAYTIEAGTLTLDAEMPAEYTLRIEAWPHLPATVKVTINAA